MTPYQWELKKEVMDYYSENHKITLRGKFSVVHFLRCFFLSTGLDDASAHRRAVALFKRVF